MITHKEKICVLFMLITSSFENVKFEFRYSGSMRAVDLNDLLVNIDAMSFLLAREDILKSVTVKEKNNLSKKI